MLLRPLSLPENAAKLAAKLHLSRPNTRILVKFALTVEHSGGLAVGLEFVSRATFHFPAGFLASIVVVFGILIWRSEKGE